MNILLHCVSKNVNCTFKSHLGFVLKVSHKKANIAALQAHKVLQ